MEDFESDEDTLDEEGFSDEETLLDVCAGLITIDQKSSVVRLVHFTAQEYFQKSRETIFPDGEKLIAKACLRYLSLPIFQDVVPSDFVLSEVANSVGWKGGLLEYASKSWAMHAQKFKMELKGCMLNFLRQGSQVRLGLWTARSRGFKMRRPDHTTLDWALLVATLNALPSVLQHYAQNGAGFKRHDGELLRKAISWKILPHDTRRQIYSCLLGGGAYYPPWLLGRIYRAIGGGLAGRDWDLLEVLIDSGFDFDILQRATADHVPTLYRFLKSVGWDIWETRLRDESERLPQLQKVCYALMSASSNLETWIHPSGTALSYAVLSRLDFAVDLLLKAGALTGPRDYLGRTPLDISIQMETLSVSKLLFDAGARINDMFGWTELHVSAYFDVYIDCFISKGLDVNATSKAEETPLHRAAYLNRPRSAHLLLHNGADANVVSVEGNTPLDAAFFRGNHDFAIWFKEECWKLKIQAISRPTEEFSDNNPSLMHVKSCSAYNGNPSCYL